jgi:serine/threonine protein kinase
MSDDPKKHPDDPPDNVSQARTIGNDGGEDPTVVVKPPMDASEERTLRNDASEDPTIVVNPPVNVSDQQTIGDPSEDPFERANRALDPTVPYGKSPRLGQVPVLDGYTIFDKLGEGAMGVVWRAIQLSTNREVALKLLPPASIGSEKAQLRFQREVESAASLEHPNIASIYESGLNKGIYYYAMQSIDGVELNRYARSRKLNEKAILALIIRLSEAVCFAHLNGIVHRDLKPGNVLVTKAEGEPKILDFGLAKSFTGGNSQNNVSIAGEVVGTPMYMSTEQAQGEVENIDGRTDIYALGIMLFELMTGGQFPYSSKGGPYDIIRRKLSKAPIRPRSIDPKINIDLEAIILKAIDVDANKRYASADLLAQDLAFYLKGRPVSARRHTAGYISQKWLHRNRLGISATLLLLIAATGFSFFKDWEGDKQQVVLRKDNLRHQEEARKAEAARAKVVAAARTDFTNRISALNTSLDEGNLAAAITQIKAIDQQDETPVGAELLAEFEGQVAALRTRLDDMQISDTQQRAAINAAAQAFKRLGQNQIAAEADLNDMLLNELDSLAKKHRDVLTEKEVNLRLDQVAEKIGLFAGEIIQDRANIEQRPSRLLAMHAFITNPRLARVYPDVVDDLLDRLVKAEQLHAFDLVNRTDQVLRVTQATGEVFDLEPDEERYFAMAFAEPTLFQFVSVMLDKDTKAVDPRFLNKTDGIKPVKAGGSKLELKDFVRKQISFSAGNDLVNLQMRHSEKEKGPWTAFAPGQEVLPGVRYVRYDRPDYHSFTNEIVVQVEETDHVVGLPAGVDWPKLRRPHLQALEQAREEARKGDAISALTMARDIAPTAFESPARREQLLSFIEEQKGNPRVVLADKLPAAEAAIEDFITAFVQRDNPLGSKAKPYRFLQGDLPVPRLNVPAFPANRLVLLEVLDRERYGYVLAWQEFFQGYTPANLDRERERGAELLENAATTKPSLSSRLLAQAAVLRRKKNSQLPDAKTLALNDPLIHQWVAHTRFTTRSLDSDACLTSWGDFLAAGGKPDRFDAAVALYASYVLINDVVEGLVKSGVGPTHPNWANDADGMLAAAEKLSRFMDAVPQTELEAALRMIESNSRSDADHRDVVVAHILSECLQRGDPKETIATSILTRRKNELSLSSSAKVELNGRLNTMKF